MLIDWFTVIAQAVNFLILVWLLKRYLYQPILHAIDAREKRIAAQLWEAAEKQAEAQRQRDDFQRKNDEFEQQRAALLDKVADEAKAERKRLLDAVRNDSESLRARLQETLNNEQRNLDREITIRTQREVFAIARKTLADLADAALEERMAETFISRLRGLDSEERSRMSLASNSSSRPIRVRSAFDLLPAQQAAIETAVREILAAENKIGFETAPDLVGGIELIINGHKLAWSIADYLAAMEKGAGEILRQQPLPDSPPPGKNP